MAIDRTSGLGNNYDVIVIGSGLGGLTAANYLAKAGHSVLLLEQHYQFGGLASWFRRKYKHIFDISLHGFPSGMLKSCRKYWTRDIASRIKPLPGLRFKNPQFDLTTSYDKEDFTNILINHFGIEPETVDAFFTHMASMNFYDNPNQTTAELFESFFPKRPDVHRLLMEPIAYANGSSLEDPALVYSIVFSNFMNKGIYIFEGGADTIIGEMIKEAHSNGVETCKLAKVDKILLDSDSPKVKGVQIGNRTILAKTVLSNANIKNTLFELVDSNASIDKDYLSQAQAVRLNTSSTQVYMGIEEGQSIENIGDLVFTSKSEDFSTEELLSINSTSRTFSLYYPNSRPQNKTDRYTIVSSQNARWNDWANLSEQEYTTQKDHLCEVTLDSIEELIPAVRSKINWVEAATPKTINKFTGHMGGTSFGTKHEGLAVSENLPNYIEGLYHAGSVGIVMSGWLGTINYGIIVANKIDQYLHHANN